ncbi:MAG: hypothetical protein GXP42_12235 [Chloroflexi bacterium]|nr:hypothetical protein [Chloroflexota bacterium]
MTNIIHRERPSSWQRNPWLALLAFAFTAFMAAYEGWSAEDLAWSFWLAGLLFGFVYLVVYHIAQRDNETWGLYFFLFFFYFIFAGFLHITFSWMAWDMTGAEMPPLFSTAPAAVARAARERWPFLLAAAINVLPDYILDARTVHFTDLGKPLFVRDIFRMIALIFILVPLTMLEAGLFALYAVLLVYFTPWDSLRQIGRRLRRGFIDKSH